MRRNPPIGPRPAHRVFTESPAFEAWFGRSVLVREDGTPMVFFHGTYEDFTVFEKVGTSSLRPLGFWFADDPDEVEAYGDRLMPVYLRVEKPYYAELDPLREKAYADKTWASRFRASLIERGYDGIIIPPRMEQVGRFRLRDSMMVVVFDPRQVKSAIGNRGTYDPADPSILRNPMRFDVQYTPEQAAYVTSDRNLRASRSIVSPALQRKSVERMAGTRHNFVVVVQDKASKWFPVSPDALTLRVTLQDVELIESELYGPNPTTRSQREGIYTAFTILHRLGDNMVLATNLETMFKPGARSSKPAFAEFYAMVDDHLEVLQRAGWASSPQKAFLTYRRLLGESVNSKMVREGYSQDWTQAFADLFPLCELTPPSRPLLLPVRVPLARRSAGRTFNEVIVPDFNVRFRAFYNRLIPSMYGTVQNL